MITQFLHLSTVFDTVILFERLKRRLVVGSENKRGTQVNVNFFFFPFLKLLRELRVSPVCLLYYTERLQRHIPWVNREDPLHLVSGHEGFVRRRSIPVSPLPPLPVLKTVTRLPSLISIYVDWGVSWYVLILSPENLGWVTHVPSRNSWHWPFFQKRGGYIHGSLFGCTRY